ncbi:hypothetical protein ACHAWU_001860 [Discostella pseudostelligera]|uniref:J domain-containing protein n=1 Tax=Discostella pseudostelligera TaxID=259834 RepID=A0ABD3M8W4_9STRA
MPFFSRKGEPLQNPYELLDLKLGATDDEISKAFKKLMFTLHPDKQPPGQSAEEAAVVAQKLYDVMDAKSFLLDGEHLAAKREYDANLVKAAMQPPPPPIIPPVASAAQPPINNVGNSNNNNGMAMPSQKTAAAAAADPSAAAAAPGKGKNNTSDPQLHVEPNPDHPTTNNKAGVKFKTNPLPSGKVNVKHWGRAKKVNRGRGKSCPATSRPETSGAAAAANDPMNHKMRHTNGNFYQKGHDNNKEFNDSNGECSTTDECGSHSDDGHNNTNIFNNKQPATRDRDSRGRRRTVDETDSNGGGGELRRPSSNKPVTRGSQQQQQQQQHPGLKPSNSNVSDKRRSRSDEGGTGVGVGVGSNHHTKRKQEVNTCADEMYNSLREAVDAFIKDLSRGSSSSIDIPPLNSSDATSFSYLGLLFHLEVPSGVGADKIMVQTWYKHRKNSTLISSLVGQFNARLHKVDTGCRVTFRNMNGKYAFTMTKIADPKHFNKKGLRHGIEYFMEMSIKLHNLINPMDMKKVDRVRLTSRGASSVVR